MTPRSPPAGHPAGDPAPITRSQRRELRRAVALELRWGLRLVSVEVSGWRTRAEAIPDPRVRRDALLSLKSKRYYADGAALFWILPARRDPQLLRLLVAFQVMANFLDQLSERGAEQRGAVGGSAMQAFVDAVTVGGTFGDYYADHDDADDGGFLKALVLACRAGCAALPGYARCRDLLAREARSAQALELGHDPDPIRRDLQLERFILQTGHGPPELSWFERASGAASAVTVIVMLAVAADPLATSDQLSSAASAYAWVAALSTLLDSYVDQYEDAESGDWSAIANYPSPAAASARLEQIVDRSLREVGTLARRERHAVIVCSMVALFLSRDSARGPLRSSARRLALAGGSLTRLLVPVLRLWRTASRQRSL